jgi:hypothetical protein
MNVPSPVPCHAKVAGIGKQSVWGVRIIVCNSAYNSVFTLTLNREFVNTRKWGMNVSRLHSTHSTSLKNCFRATNLPAIGERRAPLFASPPAWPLRRRLRNLSWASAANG